MSRWAGGSLVIDLSGAAGGTPGADMVTVTNVATLQADNFIL